MVSTPADDTEHMGFNPYRKHVASKADYAYIAAAVILVLGLLAWVLLA